MRRTCLKWFPATVSTSPVSAPPGAPSNAARRVTAASPSLIEDYGLIGDCESAALVSRTGSIDWLCWPRFDSDACFAALLGEAENGRWLIAPAEATTASTRRYLDDTLILESTFETARGVVTLT